MAGFSEALALLVFLTTALSQRPPGAQVPKDYIIDVKQKCGEEGTQTEVCVMTDLNVFIQLECKGGRLYNFTAVDRVKYCAVAHFTGDETKTCVYPKRHDLRLYCVKVLVDVVDKEGSSVGINRMIRYTMTCTYDENGEQVSGNSSIVEQYHAPNAVNGHAGKETAKGVTVLLTDIRGVPLKSGIPIDKTVCLKVLLDNSTGLLLDSKPISLFPVSCEAIGTTTGHRHAIVRSGCGDGIIIEKTKGFSMMPRVALSPYFKFFALENDSSFRIMCNFTLCSNCVGKNSCSGTAAKPRSIFKLFGKWIEAGNRMRREAPVENAYPGLTVLAEEDFQIANDGKHDINTDSDRNT
ncbi:vitelline envelope sperm lysin receptor-like [Haliotis cracherodii]|uniref:vitelline envelope sperm lysin receptor-like n=1 Tax=Haliotis cracherodii TaxID=6455 RepID=UPI0039E8B3A3